MLFTVEFRIACDSGGEPAWLRPAQRLPSAHSLALDALICMPVAPHTPRAAHITRLCTLRSQSTAIAAGVGPDAAAVGCGV